MTEYLFILGYAYELCEAELRHFLNLNYPGSIITPLHKPVCMIKTTQTIDPTQVIGILGGVVKIAKVRDVIPAPTSSHLRRFFDDYDARTLIFGISSYGSPEKNSRTILPELKAILQKKITHVRFIEPKVGSSLSSVVVKKQHVKEIILVETHLGWYVGETLTVQDPDEWSSRDTKRPHISPKSGMLPLKVARMMVNLALSQGDKTGCLLDPFCGMGTILGEALVSGWSVVGSDLSRDAVQKTRENLLWLSQRNPSLKRKFQVFVSDATHISKSIIKPQIDAIVSEPFLGALFEKKGELLYQKGLKVTETSIRDMFKGLEKLYLGAFKDWRNILRPNARIVIALPQLSYDNQLYIVKNLIDKCEKVGYTFTQNTLKYCRPHAIVKRSIHIFTFK